MQVTLCFLSLALFVSVSVADMCYECTEIIQQGAGVITPFSCAGGKFDKTSMPRTVRAKDCQGYGCLSAVTAVESLGYTSYTRGCANEQFTSNKCYEAEASLGPLNLGDLNQVLPKEKRCLCHGDFCNGAGSLNARQAVMGAVVGLLALVIMS